MGATPSAMARGIDATGVISICTSTAAPAPPDSPPSCIPDTNSTSYSAILTASAACAATAWRDCTIGVICATLTCTHFAPNCLNSCATQCTLVDP
ncbi:hypothetical protein L1049_009188 [Liquidambar formosana]|uniref:Uncharacterized protein n=1 Tax=Liquidambar formosana TaxID=63359 RepID=A0AAP0SAV3_LIQFO